MQKQINAAQTRDKIRGVYGSMEKFSKACGLTTRTVNQALTGKRGLSSRASRAKEIVARLEKENLLVRDGD